MSARRGRARRGGGGGVAAARSARRQARESHPAWLDLDAGGRARAFALAEGLRALEAAADREGLSATGRAVLERVRGLRR